MVRTKKQFEQIAGRGQVMIMPLSNREEWLITLLLPDGTYLCYHIPVKLAKRWIQKDYIKGTVVYYKPKEKEATAQK